MRGTCSRPRRHHLPVSHCFVETSLDSYSAGRSCQIRHSFSWITREAGRPLRASARLLYLRSFNAKVSSAKPSKVLFRKFSILRRAYLSDNIVPETRIDPAARALLSRYPLPTSRGTANNYRRIGKETDDQDQYDARVD